MKHISERENELPDAMIGRLLEIAVEHKEIISLGPGEPDFPAPPEIVKETKRIAGIVNHYSPPPGRHELKEAIIKKLKKENKIKADFDSVVVTTGSQEGMLLALMCAMDATEQLLLPNPTFLGYLPCAELVDVVPMPVHLKEENRFEINPDDVKKLITKKTAALLVNSPANPTGNVMRKKTMEELADIAVDNDIYIFSDEAYEHIIYDKARHVSIGSLNGMKDYVATFFTFSKSYAMCGYRVAYCVGPKDLIGAMAKSKVYTTLSTPTISQMLAVKALTMPKTYTRHMVSEYKRRRNMIVKRLNDMGLRTIKPEGAFYTFSNIQHIEPDSRKFAKALIEKAKVAVVPGVEFGLYGEGFIRCSYATEYKRIEQAMDRIEAFLKKY
jgi:aminotransferase